VTGVPVWLLLCVAVLVAPGGVTLQGHRRVHAEPDRTLPLVLDLAAAALRCGRPPADALTLAAPVGRPQLAEVLDRVARLSRLGADAEHAWSSVPSDGPLAEVARVAVRSAASGLKLAAGFERLAGELRAERAATGAVRAHRASVAAMAPLAACFLPSFVCLGVVPVVVGVARNVFGVLP
jgi:Flp pilus assembly protein TadB